MTPEQQEHVILRKYATGGDIQAIARDCNVPVETVSAVVTAVDFQRSRAAQLVRERDAALMARAKQPQETKVQPETLEQLLDRADKTIRLQPKVARVRDLISEIREGLVHAEKLAAAERRVEQARAALAAATDELRTLIRPAATTADTISTGTGPAPADVRAWAVANGIEVPPAGRIKKSIVEQYLAAQGAK